MSAHRGRCFRALRRKRDQEKKRRLGLLKARSAPTALARRPAIDSLWQQFVGIGTMMQTTQKAAKQLKQQGQQLHRQQAR